MTNKWSLVFGVVASVLLVVVLAVHLTVAAPVRSTPLVASASAATEVQRTITVIGDGSATVQPNQAQADIGVDVSAPKAEEAAQENASRMNAVIAQLNALGIDDQDIQTTNYNITPERNPGSDGSGQPTSYRVTNTVQVTIHELNKVGAILDQATQAGANTIYGVSFGLDASAQAQAEAQARRQAVANAQARADDLAGPAGIQRGDVVSISEMGVSTPVPYVFTAQAVASSVPVQPGNLDIHVQVQVTFAIR